MHRTLITLLLCTCLAYADQNGDKTLHLRRTPSPITIDGIIDPVWSLADSASSFFQQEPFYARPPTCRTVASVLTTDEALYCLVICYAKEEDIQRFTGLHDQVGGDMVSIMLDTFNDKQTAYKFAVTSTGVRSDSRMLDDARNRDYSWDAVWFSGAKIYEWGYVVEMEIPYRTIRYEKELSEWGVDFDRWIPTTNEDLYWCRYEENEGQRISKFGTLQFHQFRPSVSSLNLELYPVGIARTTYIAPNRYETDPDIGLDIFYNPSPALTFQLTANPDFAQIEADPFDFNISRYESYFSERRPFFTEGQEVFMASGRRRNSGFYRPLELFYSRRIGKILPDGAIVPLILGSKAFGRFTGWEYGGFVALTGEQPYLDDDFPQIEPRAFFGSARVKRRLFQNSSIGLLFVGKRTQSGFDGVIDIDGAFRTSSWQLAYQLARSIQDSRGDYAASAGFTMFSQEWMNLARFRAIGNDFDVSQVGFVPWEGTAEFVGLTGPVWFIQEGYIREILLYVGPYLNYEHVDLFTDRGLVVGLNMQFRDGWGYEINVVGGDNRDEGVEYTGYEISFSSWFHTTPLWTANLGGGYARTYNFSREYLAPYSWFWMRFEWNTFHVLQLGTSYDMYVEGNPRGEIEEITYNARPFFSLTPINNLNIRLYVDFVWTRSAATIEQVLAGFLFSYNFLPKSWIYLAINEARERSEEYDPHGRTLPSRLHVRDRAAVFKVRYLYYF
jgi:hypothetical protein